MDTKADVLIWTIIAGVPSIWIAKKTCFQYLRQNFSRRLLLSALGALLFTPTLCYIDGTFSFSPAWFVAFLPHQPVANPSIWFNRGLFPILVVFVLLFGAWQMLKERRDYYFYGAAMISALLQFFVYDRVEYWSVVKDWWPPDAWTIRNYLMSSFACFLLVPILLKGFFWQRCCAVLLLIIPATILFDEILWSIQTLLAK